MRERLFPAMPALQALDHDLDTFSADKRGKVIQRAEAVLAHEFDPFGSGPANLGHEIDWHADFRNGRRWPKRHFRLLELFYGDGSDVLVPWALSWGQHLPVLAAAYRVTGRQAFLDEIKREMLNWTKENPPEIGVNWASPMMVAIRATNWIAALALVADAAEQEPWFATAIATLWTHGAYLERYAETEVRNNHYVATLVGLLGTAALFRGHPASNRWHQAAAPRLIEEMRTQVNEDGSSWEGSIAYHALVTELFVLGGDLIRAVSEPALPAWYDTRTARMLQFVADYTRVDGSAPQLGDSGHWRLLPLMAYGAERSAQSHGHLLAQAGQAYVSNAGISTYPTGGYLIARTDRAHLIARCGYARNTGHLHSDQGAFELSVYGETVVVDPGTYVYESRDPESRHHFRSRGVHSTVMLDDMEEDLGDEPSSRAPILRVARGDARGAYFEADFFYVIEQSAVKHRRSYDILPGEPRVTIVDVVESNTSHAAVWTFPMPAASIAHKHTGVIVASFARVDVCLSTDKGSFTIEEGWYSRGYGVREPIPFVRLRRETGAGRDVTRLTFEISERSPGIGRP